MDPLSIAASIIAILQLSNKVIGYLNDVKEASKERAKCAVEATNLHSLLTNLRYRLEDADVDTPWFTAIRALAVEEGPLDQFKQVLELLRDRMTRGAERLGKVGEALMWKFKKEEVERILMSMERLKTLVAIALQMDHFKLSQAIKDDTVFVRDHILEIRAGVDTIKQDRDHTKLGKLRAWISPTDFVSQQSDNLRLRHEGTGQWFMDTSQFTEWIDPSNTGQTLFCTGIPGAGKTLIAAVTIDFLTTRVQSSTTGIAWIYCNYKSRGEQTEVDLLAALLKHLVRDETPGTVEIVRSLQEQCIAEKSTPSLDELKKALQDVLANFSTVYIVIDALDECSSLAGTRRQLLNHLRQLQSCTDIRLMVTSRMVPEIIDEFQDATTVEVRAHDEDVTRFVAGQMDRLPRCIQRDADLQRLVCEKITGATDGMFLLARLYVDALLDKRTKSRVRSTLDALSNGSQTLEQAYEDAIRRLGSQLPEDSALAKRVISWIVYAQRSFHIAELRCALSVELGDTSFDPDNLLDTEDIVSVCAGLVTVDRQSNIIRLVHYTAQEYFDRIRTNWIPDGHLDITRTCLTYLSFEAFRDGSCSDRLKYGERMNAYPFLQYAARHWGRHARFVQDDVLDLVCSTLLDQGRLSSMSQVLRSQVLRSRIWFYNTFPRVNILHVLAHFGLHILAERILALSNGLNDHWVTQKDDKQETCLYIAAERGHDAMVSLLLDKGAEVDEEVGRFGSVLHVAVHEGNLSAVKLLLDAGADINVKDRRDTDKFTALHRAAAINDPGMVHLLLEYGADVTIENIHGQTPLQLAIERTSYEVVKLLFGDEAVTSTQNNISNKSPNTIDVDAHNRTLLHLSAQRGDIDTYLYIAEQGIDPLARDAKGDDLLSYAASSGSLHVFEAALSTVPVSALQKGHWSSLHWACKAGNGEIVKRLLQCGLRSHSVALSHQENRWSPADIAIFHGHVRMLEDMPDSCKAALGPIEKPGRVSGAYRLNIFCDGCLMEIYGTRFKCRTCPDFDYCFMCMPFLGHLHEGHVWEHK